MSDPVVHLVRIGDDVYAPCPRCGRTLHRMNREDTFTLDDDDATCEAEA